MLLKVFEKVFDILVKNNGRHVKSKLAELIMYICIYCWLMYINVGYIKPVYLVVWFVLSVKPATSYKLFDTICCF